MFFLFLFLCLCYLSYTLAAGSGCRAGVNKVQVRSFGKKILLTTCCYFITKTAAATKTTNEQHEFHMRCLGKFENKRLNYKVGKESKKEVKTKNQIE